MKGININKLGKQEKNQKIKEGDCIFPFKHLWKEHNECVDTDKGKICATSVTDRGTLKTYGYCKAPNDTTPINLKKGTKKDKKINKPHKTS